MKRLFALGSAAFAAALASPSIARACAVCYGDPSAEITQGAKAGVLLLLGVIVFVLVWIAAVALFWVRRARMLDAAATYDERPKIALFPPVKS